MDFDSAREALKEGYLQFGLEYIHSLGKELVFRCFNKNLLISEDEINAYGDSLDMIPSLQQSPVDCSICDNTYREQVLIVSDSHLPIAILEHRNQNYYFGDSEGEKIYASIGRASNLFVDYFRFNEEIKDISTRRFTHLRYSSDEFRNLSDLLYKPLTIKVFNLKEKSIEDLIRKTDSIIDACLFEYSKIRNESLSLLEGWNSRRRTTERFVYKSEDYKENFPLPRAVYNADILKFYQRGIGTDDPVIEFLSFYQILEYFFLKVSDEKLYTKISRCINDPSFSAIPKKLDLIINEVNSHKFTFDETEMLKQVLEKFVEPSEVIEFIKMYEDHISKNLYTKKNKIFGNEYQINLNDQHAISNVSKTIKILRNALVHSSDTYERSEKYIPTAESENQIRMHIPLVRFLAEKVIVGSATPLQL